MKNFLRPLSLLSCVVLLGACGKKETTVEGGTPPEPGAPEATAPAAIPGDPGTPAPAGAKDATPAKSAIAPAQENPALVGLSPADKAKYEAWFKKYNLKGDSGEMDQDTDGDGYTNREEFNALTDPRDPKSVPGVLEGVSLKVTEEVNVPMILREVKGTTARVERPGGGEEQLVTGSTPKDLPYKVTGVKHEVKADKHGVYVDASSVTMLNTKTRETVVLVRDLPARSSETNAVVVGPNGQEKKIHLDETVELPGLPGRQFKVLEMRPEQVLVEEIGTKNTLSIPKR
jgi:hypothetical protein